MSPSNSATRRGGVGSSPIPTDEEVEQAFDVLRRHYDAQRAQRAPSAPTFVFTADPVSLATVGYTRRSLEAPILRGELAAAKVTRGYRVALEDLRAWEARPRVRPGRRPSNEGAKSDIAHRDVKPANERPPALRAVPALDPDEELLARAVAAGGRR